MSHNKPVEEGDNFLSSVTVTSHRQLRFQSGSCWHGGSGALRWTC